MHSLIEVPKYVVKENIDEKNNQDYEKESQVPQVVLVYLVQQMKRVIVLFGKQYRLIIMITI